MASAGPGYFEAVRAPMNRRLTENPAPLDAEPDFSRVRGNAAD